jgi:hypothetical protein
MNQGNVAQSTSKFRKIVAEKFVIVVALNILNLLTKSSKSL